MPQIKLNATLQAYSKAPFYSDWVRDVSAQNGSYEPIQEILNSDGSVAKIAWVRALNNKNEYQWYPIDVTALDASAIEELRQQLFQYGTSLEENLEGIYLSAPYLDEATNNLVLSFYNKFGWINNEGVKEYVRTISLPGVYPDNRYIYKNLDAGNTLTLVNTEDNATIKVVPKGNPTIAYDQINQPVMIQPGAYQVEGIHVDNPVSKWATGSILTGKNLDNALLQHDIEIEDLKQIVQGKAGFLDPIDTEFIWDGTGDREEAFQTFLTKNALTQLFGDNINVDITNIPDQTKVIYKNHVYTFTLTHLLWQDSGMDVVVEANNGGVFGVVTGDATTPYKVKVEADGTMSVNELENSLDLKVSIINNTTSNDIAYIQTEEGVSSYIEVDTTSAENTLAKRKADGSLECNKPEEMTNKTVLNYQWYKEQFATNQDIKKLWEVTN